MFRADPTLPDRYDTGVTSALHLNAELPLISPAFRWVTRG